MEQAIKFNDKNIDYITFVGSGEPTLYKDLDELILKAKELSKKPVCVITNGSLLFQEDVQSGLMYSDVVIPSFDAGNERLFKKINRPHPSISFRNLLQGMINFNDRFEGEFWVEVMVMKGINDSKEDLFKIKRNLDLINPDKIDINVPIRPPVEEWVKIPDETIISTLDEVFEDYSNINFPEKGIFRVHSTNFEKELLAILERHPMRQNQIIETFLSSNFNKKKIISELENLITRKKIKKIIYNEQVFWKKHLD
jgi:wyosine [tRNA(Phe)-imidazoG37] synthetase (radical SAM superfamily)